MNLGNPIKVVPLRATTGLCGGAIHICDSSAVAATTRANDSHGRNRLRSILTFAFFAIQQIAIFRFELFALYNADRATCPWPGMTPVSGRWPQAGAASVVLPHEAVKLEGTLEG
jgi:hypothetical protein